MTTPDTATPDLGSFGAWTFPPNASYRDFGPRVTPGQAREIERLGYGTLWVTGSPPAELSFAEPFLESTTALKVATGVVNIWSADAKPVAESFHRINTAYPGRFVLGIGARTDSARAVGRKVLDGYNYLGFTNYVSNFKRLGFTDADLIPPGSDKLVDALIAYGTPDEIAKRLGEHLRAGANHVVIQVLPYTQLLPTLAELAGPLGLKARAA
jgi:alkanesulfonate monooxygenase SsuD/methylene tetrahydromethanopterin reductase-like flavin-dependent oxidoreductase (luciferase family)